MRNTLRAKSLAQFLPVVIIALAAAGFTGAWIQHQGGDVSRLVVAGDGFVDPAKAPDCVSVTRASGGYDGQFFYRLAVAPFSTRQEAAGIRFDYPVYRSQRIVYPLLAFIAAAGDACRALWTLPLVSIAALMLLVASAAQLLRVAKVPPIFAVAAGAWPGFLFSIARDLAEPLAAAFLVAGLAAATRRSHAWSAFWLVAAALTRETTILAAAVLVLYGVIISVRTRRLDPLVVAGSLPVIAHVSWKLLLFAKWNLPVHWGTSDLGAAPFTAWWKLFRSSVRAGGHAGRLQAIELGALAVFALLVVVALIVSRADIIVKACCVACLLFASTMGSGIWIEDWAFLRAITEFGVLGTILLVTSPPKLRITGALFTIVAAGALAFEMLQYR